jgi:hypothetical protein
MTMREPYQEQAGRMCQGGMQHRGGGELRDEGRLDGVALLEKGVLGVLVRSLGTGFLTFTAKSRLNVLIFITG